jgi:hypothetical protein
MFSCLQAKLLIIIYILGLSSNAALAQAPAECRIYSDVNRQYLYRSTSFFTQGNVYTWATRSGFFTNPYDTNMIYTEKDKKGLWYFEPAEGFSNVYYLRNKYYHDYLHTSQHRVPLSSFTEGMRYVYTNKIKPAHLETYLWRLERVKSPDARYTIRNVKYNEPLAISKPVSRHFDVYTVDGPTSQTWTLRCKSNILPYSGE